MVHPVSEILYYKITGIKVFGKGIVSYEGGQHYTDFNVPPYIQAMYDVPSISIVCTPCTMMC
jgi:hypothetical protein